LNALSNGPSPTMDEGQKATTISIQPKPNGIAARYGLDTARDTSLLRAFSRTRFCTSLSRIVAVRISAIYTRQIMRGLEGNAMT